MTATLLGGLFKARSIRNALIVSPKSMVLQWEKELQCVVHQCNPNVHIQALLANQNAKTRHRIIESARKCTISEPHILIVTYGLIRTANDPFCGGGKSTTWSYVVLDEGHTIKNHSSQISQQCQNICGEHTSRVLLTGTPFMNRLEVIVA